METVCPAQQRVLEVLGSVFVTICERCLEGTPAWEGDGTKLCLNSFLTLRFC